MLLGVARHGAPTPCIPRAPSREGQGETEARFTTRPLAPGYPSAVPTALSSVSGKWGTQAAPPACSHTPGMAPEPARGSGPTRRHPVAELVPLGPTAVGAAPAGDSTQGRPCPDLHQPPGPRTGRGAPPHPDPRGSPRQQAPQGTHVVGNRHGHPLPWGWGEKRSSSHPMASKRASRETEAL